MKKKLLLNKAFSVLCCKYFYVFFFVFLTSMLWGQTLTDNNPGSRSWTVPAGVTSVTAEVWGSGGSGGGSSSHGNSGSGAGGGGYSSKIFNVAAGNTINYTVGAGALAGDDGNDGNDGNVSTLTHDPSGTTLTGNGGGKGNKNGGAVGAGGGGAGGTSTSGSNGGAGGSNKGGNGGDGGNTLGTGGAGQSDSNGLPGIVPGGGGGGGEKEKGKGQVDRAGGAGGNGQIKLTYISVTSIAPSPVCVGSTITITGTNFLTTGTTTVSINGIACTNVTVENSTTIKADVAAGTTSGVVDVYNPNGTNNGQSITVNPSPGAIGGGASAICVGSATPAFTNSVGGGTWSITNGTGSATITAVGVVTGVSAGSATVVYTVGTCSVSTPITVIVTPVITTNPSNVSVATGANASFTVAASNIPTGYTWQVSTDGGVSWAAVSNGGVYSNATTATLNITGATFGMNGYMYRASATNACGTSAYSSHGILSVAYCTPTFKSSNIDKLYIKSFRFVGVLNDDLLYTPFSANLSTQSGTNGAYQDFTGLSPIATQSQGSIVNLEAISGGNIVTPAKGRWVAWVDWNRDGDFSSSELVYLMDVGLVTESVTFGFPIPNNLPLGDYRLRIAVLNSTAGATLLPCDFSTTNGEVEDYIFRVIEDNLAKLDTDQPNVFHRCEGGEISLTAIGKDANVVDFKWYDAKYGGNLLHTGATFTTNVTATKPFYVTAVDVNGKETPFRYPFIARIDPKPEVTFTPMPQTICGEDDPYLILSVWGDKREEILIDEKFDAGLGAFINVKEDTFTDTKNTPAYSPDWVTNPNFWKPSGSTEPTQNYYRAQKPPHLAIASTVSSGYFGGYFAAINTDVYRDKNIKRHLVATQTFDTTPFLSKSLKLDFDVYYYSIATIKADGYLSVEYTTDNTNWIPFKYFVLNHGNPLIWEKVSLNLDDVSLSSQFPAPANNVEEVQTVVPRSTTLKIRFSVFSSGFTPAPSYFENFATIDNIKLYGYVPFQRDFQWSGLDNAVLYDETCTTPLGNTLARTVCVKPPLDEFEKPYWEFNAYATFLNGCPAINTTRVYNDTKIWNQPGKTDWSQSNDWKPVGVPDIKKCVIARTPVDLPSNISLGTNTQGLARSVIVKSGGKLTISPKSSLTIQNYIKNEAGVSDVVVESDASLLQNNNSAINSGQITVRRVANLKRLDYNYWGSPVVGQNVRAFSPGTLDTRFYVYNESNDYFDGLFVHNLYPDNVTSSQTPTVDKNTYQFITGKGYGIRASNILTSTVTAITHEFKGVPFNGIVDVPLVKSADTVDGGFTYEHGYNLIANPYPSNIDFYALYNYSYNSGANKNSDLIYNTAYFWTNTNFNPKMQGSKYPSNVGTTTIINNYAVLNGTGGLGAPYGFVGVTGVVTPVSMVPNSYIKPGQGFIVKAKGNGNLRFENGSGVRSNNSTGNFFNRVSSVVSKDRFWLSLKTPLDFVSPILLGYVNGATDGYDEDFDAELMIYGGDSFFSVLHDKKLGIQGRQYPFNVSDSVPLGARFGLQGQYEIFIENKEGVFASQQPIYLKDNVTGVVTDLSQGKYVFTANVGESMGRFEIQYTNQGTLNTSEVNNKTLRVYLIPEAIVVESPIAFETVEVYDTSGKLIYHKTANSKKVEIDRRGLVSGVYFVIIEVNGKKMTKSVIL